MSHGGRSGTSRCWLLILGAALAMSGLLVYANWGFVPLPPGVHADRVVVKKASRLLQVFSQGKLVRTYSVALGQSPVGPKMREGDNRTPEGDYILDRRNPGSGYHLSLHVSYPSAEDAARARQGGYAPGGAIMIHGMKNGLGWIGRLHRLVDWTRGCIALTDSEMEELWRVVPDGTPIRIDP